MNIVKLLSACGSVIPTGRWPDTDRPLPDDKVLAQFLRQPRQESSAISGSCVEPYRDVVAQWVTNGVQAKTIYQTLACNHRFSGSYASVYRFVRSLKPTQPGTTMHLNFETAEAVQVDFGTEPRLVDTWTGEEHKTWFTSIGASQTRFVGGMGTPILRVCFYL